MRGRVEEARAVTMKLHSMKSDPDNEFARSEFYQMSKQAEFDRTLTPSWIEMFRRPSYRKRTLLAMGFAFVGQSTAVLVINNYVRGYSPQYSRLRDLRQLEFDNCGRDTG